MVTLKKNICYAFFALFVCCSLCVFFTACKADIFGASNHNTGSQSGPTETGGFTPLTLGLTPGNDTTELRFNWYTTGNPTGKVAQVRIHKGTETPAVKSGRVITASSGYTAHKVTVTGLEPDSEYAYQVSNNGTAWSEEYRFKVPPAGDFRFIAIADPQINTVRIDNYSRYPANTTTTAASWAQSMRKIAEVPDVCFIANMGDQIDNANGSETEYTRFFAPEGLRKFPFSTTVGNHDTNANYFNHFNTPNEQFLPENATAANILLADMGNYYYRYNNVLFVVLNTGYATPSTRTDALPYITKFKQVLEAAKAAHEGQYDWLIVQHHKSTASVANHVADRDIQAYVEAGFETLMSEEEVDFVLAGHDHVYARSYPLEGMDNGKVSLPDKSQSGHKGETDEARTVQATPGKPIYLTFTTVSGCKYYQVSADKTFPYNDTITTNTSYPYLSADISGTAGAMVGSSSYRQGNLPVSNAVFVQPWIPSYCIVDVTSTSISFKTYPVGSKEGQNSGAAEGYSFDENTPYDSITVTK